VTLNPVTNLVGEVTAFVANNDPADQVQLSWTDNTTGETGYRVQRRIEPNGLFITVADLPANSVSATLNAGLTNGLRYRYRVAPLDGTRVGPYIPVFLNLAATPAAPTNMVGAPGATAGVIDLTWTDNSNNNTRFQLQRCRIGCTTAGAGTWGNIALVGPKVEAFSNTGLIPGVNFMYRVRAQNSVSSAWAYTPGFVTVP
jgi:titin